MHIHQYATFLALVGLLAAAGTMPADESRKGVETVFNDVTPSVGAIVTGSQLLGKSLYDKNSLPVGTVEDIVLDPFYAQAVSFVIKPTSVVERTLRVLVPCQLVAPMEDGNLKATVTAAVIEKSATSLSQQGSQPYTRRLSVATFRHYVLQPYWLQEEQEREGTDRDDRFVMLTNLKQKMVKSSAGTELGKIVNVVISPLNGKIVYTLFAHQHDAGTRATAETRTFPIPLAAFVIPHHGDTWLLELPEFALDNTQRVQGDDLPQELPRAWVEYIHVRYGGGVFAGVQRELKTTQ